MESLDSNVVSDDVDEGFHVAGLHCNGQMVTEVSHATSLCEYRGDQHLAVVGAFARVLAYELHQSM